MDRDPAAFSSAKATGGEALATRPPPAGATGGGRRARLAELALVAIAAVWGATFVLVQDAVRELPVTTFLAYRFTSAGLLLAVLFARPLARLGAAGWKAGLRMGVYLTAGYVLQTYGLQRTTASNAGFITGLFVVLTPLFGAALYGQRASRVAWSAAGVSAVGLFLLSGLGGNLHPEGDTLVLLCACAFALHILATSRAVRDHHAGALAAVQLGFCGAVNLVGAAAAGDLQAPPSSLVWTALVVTSLVASALGFLVQTYAQKWTTPARTALLIASEPAFAGLFGYLLKDERLSALGWTGAGLIMASIVTVEWYAARRSAREMPP
jgi:drug/metabolite transporter (DMT)-like permease